MKANANRITEGVIWKQLLLFFFPILLGTFFQQMYNTVDTIIVGRALGTQALAAVGTTAPLFGLINGFFIGLSSGATVILSQFWGANDRTGAHRAMHTGIALALVLGTLTALTGIFLGPRILRLIQTPENCLADATLYTQVYFSGAVASMVYNMGSGILRAMGDSRRPLYFLVFSCFLNIAMDLLCVVVLGMGVAGAALATVISQFISAILVLLLLANLKDGPRLRLKDLGLDGKLLARILAIGVPAGIQFITFDISNLLIQSGINSFGAVTLAAWTAYSKTDALTWMISGAFGVAITTFVGQNFGAQKYKRIRTSVWVCMGMSVSTVGLLSALMVIFRSPILSIYTTDPEVIKVGAYVLCCIAPFNAVFMPIEVFAGTMRGTGYSLVPTLITCLCICVFRVLWVLLVVSRFHTIRMLSLSYPLSWILASLMFFIVYLRGNWLRKRIEACGLEPEVR